MPIVQLDETLSNKIAAGEVVERPASVVKELLENAIDAGSRQIDIELDEGGLSRIQMTDDGSGIPAEQAERAFLRHATSKIQHEDDLQKLQTLGFRGEALPSIASVSKLTIETAADGQAGIRLRYQGGRLIAKSKTKARQGTVIAVEELFFNTPARLKHMKTVNTELGNVGDVINRTVLARPDVSFRFVHNGKQLLFTNGNGDSLAVIYAVYGKQVAESMLQVSHSSLDYKISAYIAIPEITRASRHYMSTYINGRYIKHFPLIKAIEKGYQTLLPIHRYPIVVLSIDMDPTLVDVNVHPSKWDVRLSKEDVLLEEVSTAIRERLQRETLIPETKERDVQTFQKVEEKHEVRELPLRFTQKTSPNKETGMDSLIRQNAPGKTNEAPPERLPKEAAVFEKAEKVETKQKPGSEHEHPGKEKPSSRVPTLYPIGQLHGTYILAQNENGLYMIDQHAAQERIHYERYRKKLAEPAEASQALLVPLTMNFSPQETARLMEMQELIEHVGLYMEPFGTNTFRVSAHPTWFPRGLEEETIRELTTQVLTAKKPNIGVLREEAAILMSCKAAIKANHHLNYDEMFALTETLRTCESPFTCPHGRPVIVHITNYELEKMFKRVM